MTTSSDVLIVGGGIFGLAAAVELRARGATVTLLDPGPIPHPDAASTDISKLVRLDYGSDESSAAMMEEALVRWRRLNHEWGTPLFHETGIAVLSSSPLRPGTFEGDSFELLAHRGHALERLDRGGVRARFPAWKKGAFVDGYYNPKGGWAESGRVVEAMLARARRAGTTIVTGARVLPLAGDGPVTGVVTESGDRYSAETTVVAAGAFTPVVLPELADRIVPIAQNVFHFEPAAPETFAPPAFVPWAADIATTGWYGFAYHAGVVKVANHGPGVRVDPAAPR
ncbi:MAG TPA: FAD-dependent oxidoreductase, partial [Polyangiaceae bacterium]|nr:FAD-dependent oxidoreductase [Polyangiaceae bacterium]